MGCAGGGGALHIVPWGQFPQMDLEHMDFTPLSAPAASPNILATASRQEVRTSVEPTATGTVHAIGYWFIIELTPAGSVSPGDAGKHVVSTAPARFGGHENSGWRQCVVMLEHPVAISYVGTPRSGFPSSPFLASPT